MPYKGLPLVACIFKYMLIITPPQQVSERTAFLLQPSSEQVTWRERLRA